MEIIEQSHIILTALGGADGKRYYEILKGIEVAGRTAYKSEDLMTPSSAERFVTTIIARGHESVLEHFNISVRFITDRGVTHEIVRHRLVSYTQESTRYCNYAGKEMQFIKPVFWKEGDLNYFTWVECVTQCELDYNTLIAQRATPQEARTVLPNSLKTEIVCTTNVREWRHILRLRTDKTAHPQMRALMIPLLYEFQEKLPALFVDISIKE